jgi:hypothetical protein
MKQVILIIKKATTITIISTQNGILGCVISCSIYSNSSHVAWRAGSSDTFLTGMSYESMAAKGHSGHAWVVLGKFMDL